MITLAPIPAPTVSQFMSHPPTHPITQPPPHQTSRHPKAYATVRLLLILKGWVWSPLALWLSHSLFPPKQSYSPHSLTHSFSKQPPPTDDSPLVTYPKFQLFKSHHSFLLQPPPLDCNWSYALIFNGSDWLQNLEDKVLCEAGSNDRKGCMPKIKWFKDYIGWSWNVFLLFYILNII